MKIDDLQHRMSSTNQQQGREKLEVPLVTGLERRLNVVGPDATSGTRPNIGPVPRSSVLDKLRQFMPQMEAANTKLKNDMQAKPAAEFDIEAVGEDAQEGYIEMDLACGVVDLLDADAVAAAENSMLGQRGPAGASSSSSSDDDDSDSSDTSVDEGQVQGEIPADDGADQEMADAIESRGAAEESVVVSQDMPGQPRRKVRAKRTSMIQELT